jgi:CrcB protein
MTNLFGSESSSKASDDPTTPWLVDRASSVFMNPTSTPATGELGPGDDSAFTSTTKARFNAGNNMTLSIIAIIVGASLGALLRWYFANRLNTLFPQLPPGTLAANILGGYLIGIAMAVFLAYPTLAPEWRLLTVTGFLGGLTTFSTFSAEVVTALIEGRALWAAWTIAVHVTGSVVMTFLGVGTVRLVRNVF